MNINEKNKAMFMLRFVPICLNCCHKSCFLQQMLLYFKNHLKSHWIFDLMWNDQLSISPSRISKQRWSTVVGWGVGVGGQTFVTYVHQKCYWHPHKPHLFTMCFHFIPFCLWSSSNETVQEIQTGIFEGFPSAQRLCLSGHEEVKSCLLFV